MGVNSITKTKPVAKEFSPMQMALGTRDPSKTTRCTDLVSILTLTLETKVNVMKGNWSISPHTCKYKTLILDGLVTIQS